MRTGGRYLGRKVQKKAKRRNCFDYEIDKLSITSWDEWINEFELPDWAT